MDDDAELSPQDLPKQIAKQPLERRADERPVAFGVDHGLVVGAPDHRWDPLLAGPHNHLRLGAAGDLLVAPGWLA